MTTKANTKSITIKSDKIVVNEDGSITVPLESVTDLVRAALAARKDAYAARREAKKGNAKKKLLVRAAKLKAELAALETATA